MPGQTVAWTVPGSGADAGQEARARHAPFRAGGLASQVPCARHPVLLPQACPGPVWQWCELSGPGDPGRGDPCCAGLPALPWCLCQRGGSVLSRPALRPPGQGWAGPTDVSSGCSTPGTPAPWCLVRPWAGRAQAVPTPSAAWPLSFRLPSSCCHVLNRFCGRFRLRGWRRCPQQLLEDGGHS